jgi:chromate transport protein ChrA
MTAFLVLILVAVVVWQLGLNGLIRWSGIAAIALGLTVVLGVEAAQGIPVVAAGVFVWLIGKAIQPVASRDYAL